MSTKFLKSRSTMTLEYRCSNCGTLLQTTNADPLHDEIERLRSQLVSAVPSDEFINAFLKADGSFVYPHVALRESGVPVDMDISQDDADAFNAEARNQFRASWTKAKTLLTDD